MRDSKEEGEMKIKLKFFLKFALVIVLALCILFPISILYQRGDTYNGTYAGIKKFEDVPQEIEFANFGPSYGMNCFDYAKLDEQGKTCFNFALTMQDLYHDYEIYKKYQDNFKEGAVVAITVSYFSFCSDNDAASSARYYKILDSDSIKGYTLENDISAKFLPVYGKGNALIRDITNDMLNEIMSNSVESNEVEEGNKALELENDSKVRVLTIENGNLKPYGKYVEENEDLLVNWIKEMKDNGLNPVLVLTPYWENYANGFDKELLKNNYSDPISRVVEKTDVPYVNFNLPEYQEYTTTPEYFNNCDHVSKKGGVAFMELFVEYLKTTSIYKF